MLSQIMWQYTDRLPYRTIEKHDRMEQGARRTRNENEYRETKGMAVTRNEIELEIKIGQRKVEQVSEFKYLGVYYT